MTRPDTLCLSTILPSACQSPAPGEGGAAAPDAVPFDIATVPDDPSPVTGDTAVAPHECDGAVGWRVEPLTAVER
ncbi:MAG: hypothetical protein AAF211_33650 [Myxococcota bacterium]